MRNLIWIILAVSIGLGCAEPPKSEPIIPATNEKPVEPTKPPVVDVKTDQGEVEILQVRLSALGFDTGPIDNDFGPKTKAALKAFQKSKGLPETGLVDLTTWKALLKASEKPTVENPPASEPAGVVAEWDKIPEGPKWTAIVVKALGELGGPMLALKELKDQKDFCPNYPSLNMNQKIQFYTMLVSTMAKFESGFNTKSAVHECRKTCVYSKCVKVEGLGYCMAGGDPADGGVITSRGLLQMSYRSAVDFNCGPKSAEQMHDPEMNLRCGVRVLNYFISRDKRIGDDADLNHFGGGKYWAVLRQSKGYNKNSRDAIASRTRSLPFCQ
jgi:hypothetical protein